MDLGSIPFILTVVLLLVVFYFFRGRGGGVRNRPELIQSLLSEVKLDQALLETFNLRQKPKKFETTSWQIYENRIDFLEEWLQDALAKAFGMIEDFNQQIQIAKKEKSVSYMNIDVAKLRGPLAKSKKGLEDWLEETTGHRELPIRYPSPFGWFFGER